MTTLNRYLLNIQKHVNLEYIIEADENADTADSFLKKSATFLIQNILWSWNALLTN